MRLSFEDTGAVIDVPDELDFLTALQAATTGWPFAPGDERQPPLVSVRRVGAVYEVTSAGEEAMLLTAVSAACRIVVDLIGAYIDAHPQQLCFHCGSVVVNGRLLIFPSRSHAGKSTLVARLAADGHTVFGDDVLPVAEDDEFGMVLGLAPRLRLPLPAAARPEFRSFVAGHASVQDERYLYLALPDGGLAARGTTVPLGAIVLLDRQPAGPAYFAEAPRGATLKALIAQNFSRSAPGPALIDRLHAVMDRLPRLLLRYSDVDEAAELIGAAFSTWPPEVDLAPAPELADETLPAEGEEEAEDEPAVDYPPELKFRQTPDIYLRSVDGELFLAGGEATIHHLNTVGAGIWNLLAEPTDRIEATAILHAAFPDADPALVAADVAAILAALAGEGFILPVEETPDTVN